MPTSAFSAARLPPSPRVPPQPLPSPTSSNKSIRRPDLREAADSDQLEPLRTLADVRARLSAFSPSWQRATAQASLGFAASGLVHNAILARPSAVHDATLAGLYMFTGPAAAWALVAPLLVQTQGQLRASKAAIWALIGVNYGQIAVGLALRGPEARAQHLAMLPAYVVVCAFPLMLYFLPPVIAQRRGADRANQFSIALSTILAAAVSSAGLRLYHHVQAASEPIATTTRSHILVAQQLCDFVTTAGMMMMGARLLSLWRRNNQTHASVDGMRAVVFSTAAGCLVGAFVLAQQARQLGTHLSSLT